MSRFLSRRFDKLEPYVPGEQPRDMKYVKLNTNESPYPPSPEVINTAKGDKAASLNLYPDPTGSALKEKIAALYNVKKENVFLSNGSDDILNFSFMAFCDKDNGAVFPDISYGFYQVYADLYGVDYKKIPLKDDFSINPSDYFNAENMVVIANPNAPTGLMLGRDDIRAIIENNRDNPVIIDEAYVDFGGESSVDLINEYDNLLIVQTFSKSRSMAGARLGFAIGSKGIISDLETIKFSTNPYSINSMTMAMGEAAIDSNDYYMENAAKIVETREYTIKELKKRNFMVTDSKANFIFARHSCIEGTFLYEELKKRGVLVRHFDTEKIKDYLRITIGTKEQMDILLKNADDIIKEKEALKA